VLFLFVVMLLNAPHEDTEEDLVHPLLRPGPMRFGAVLAAALVVELVWALTKGGGESGQFAAGAVTSVATIGRSLFTDYAFPFEVTSILILVAMVGAVILARREAPDRGAASAPPEAR
jgi:NADH-quinone oxidoreductase subunit J